MTATARLKQLLYIAAALALVGLGLVAAVSTASPARATDTTPCVPKDAYTETVVDEPAFTETVVDQAAFDETVIDKPAFTETVVDSPAVAGFWTNFQPNDTKAPFVGPPTYPTDARGSWSDPKEEGGPQPDASGVYANGNADKGGNWFYRQQAVPEQSHQVEHPAETHVVHHPAVTHDVFHPAVTHDVFHPAVTCDPPVDTSKKVVVCKYVGTPPGQLDHIVIVSENTLNQLDPPFTGSFPFSWTDAQGQTTNGSIAIRYATDGEQAKDVPLTECPGPTPPQEICPEGTDHAGDPFPVAGDETSCNDQVPPEICPDGTDHAGEPFPVAGDETSCTDVVPPAEKKVVVCKYVGTPPGQLDHIVIVSENTLNQLDPPFTGSFPFSWTDAQGQTNNGSIAIRYATDGEQAQDVPVTECPGPPPEICPDGTDHAGDPFPVAGDETSCNDPDQEICPDGTDHAGDPFPVAGDETSCNDPDQEICPDGTDHAGDPFPVAGDETSCNDPDQEICPEGTDHAGDPFPIAGDEASCNDADQGPLTCPAGTDKAGEEIPADKTAEEFCDDDDDEVCPKGTDHAGEEVKHGEDPEKFCNDDEKPPVDPTDPTSPNGPSHHPNPGPTVKGAQATAPTASHSTPKAAGTPAARVPTAVDAGLAPAQRDLTGNGGPLGLLGIATALAGAVLVGASLRPRRGRSLTG